MPARRCSRPPGCEATPTLFPPLVPPAAHQSRGGRRHKGWEVGVGSVAHERTPGSRGSRGFRSERMTGIEPATFSLGRSLAPYVTAHHGLTELSSPARGAIQLHLTAATVWGRRISADPRLKRYAQHSRAASPAHVVRRRVVAVSSASKPEGDPLLTPPVPANGAPRGTSPRYPSARGDQPRARHAPGPRPPSPRPSTHTRCRAARLAPPARPHTRAQRPRAHARARTCPRAHAHAHTRTHTHARAHARAQHTAARPSPSPARR